jgi:toxin FitB
MSKVVLLDTGPLGMASHRRPNKQIVEWLNGLLQSGNDVLVPEIADYEVRRELLRAKKTRGIERLDELKRTMGYVRITTQAMLKAAEFWALARAGGRPTANDEAIDGDAILAAQAATFDVGSDEIVIATTNVKHLSRFARAELWLSIQ